MKLGALLVVVAIAACGKSEDKRPPMEAPKLSAAGDVVVPKGHETTFVFDGTPTTLEYSWLEVLDYQGKAAIRLLAQGGPRHGLFTMLALIPPGTATLDQLKGYTVGAVEDGVSFGNTPEMATGTGATIWIDDVGPAYIAGRFEAQACNHGERRCAIPKQITKGTFRAFRSALSDDAAFSRYVTKR